MPSPEMGPSELDRRVRRHGADIDALYEISTRIEGKVDSVDRRVGAVEVGLHELGSSVDRRFDAVDQRFEAMDRRFDGVGQRLDGIGQRFDGVGRHLDGIDQQLEAILTILRGR